MICRNDTGGSPRPLLHSPLGRVAQTVAFYDVALAPILVQYRGRLYMHAAYQKEAHASTSKIGGNVAHLRTVQAENLYFNVLL